MLKNKKIIIFILLVVMALITIVLLCGNRKESQNDTNIEKELDGDNSGGEEQEDRPEGAGLVEKETEDDTSENATDASGSWEGSKLENNNQSDNRESGNGNDTQGSAPDKSEDKDDGKLGNDNTIHDDKTWGDLY